ncbi:hypothetical protein JW823_09420 [bacterium]|nr:hypothetical protein [candidate division CSSED10-310 bacterium]
MFIKKKMELLLWIGIMIRVSSVWAGVMGIDQPGTTDWPNHWCGCISDVLPLDYDASPSSISIDPVRGNAYVTFSVHYTPYIRKVSLADLSFEEPIKWNFSLGSILDATQMPGMDRTLFLSHTENHCFLIQMSNLNDQIVHISKLDCQPIAPLIYSQLLHCAFCRDGNDSRKVYKISIGTGEVFSLTANLVESAVIDLIFDEESGFLYALSSDYPGDVIRIEGETFQVQNAITLPGYLRCEQGLLDPANEQIIIKAEGATYSDRYLITVEIQNFTTGSCVELPSAEIASKILGTYEDCILVLVSGEPSVLVRYTSSNLNRLDDSILPGGYGVFSTADMQGNSAIIADDAIPTRIGLVSCDPLSALSFNQFSGKSGKLKSISINPLKNEIIAASLTVNPTFLFRIDADGMYQTDSIEYSLNIDGSLSLIDSASIGNFTYGFHSGSPSYLVRINNSDYSIDMQEPLPDSFPAVDMIVDDMSGSVFILRSSSISRHDSETLVLLDVEEFGYPDDGQVCLIHDPIRDQLIACNSRGKAFRIAKSPLAVIEEALLPAAAMGSITQGVYLQGRDAVAVSVKTGESEPAYLAELDLMSFEFTEFIETAPLETELPAMTYDSSGQFLTYGVGLLYGGLVSYRVHPFERINQHALDSIGRYLQDGIQNSDTGDSFWCNSYFVGVMAKSQNTSYGFITGSKTNTFIPVEVSYISLFSHYSDGNFRLGIYDEAFQLLWQSPEMINTAEEDWISISVNQGEPQELSLLPGDYWLVFQTDSHHRVSSAHAPAAGQGIRQPADFGRFPETLWYPDITDDQWAIYVEWDYLYPTATPSPIPSATPSPVPSATPTRTVTPSPSPTSSPGPEPGVTLEINRLFFGSGDPFLLEAAVQPNPDQLDKIHLWVILDVYGSFWFGPSWTQLPDWYDLGLLAAFHRETILDFIWPDVTGSAEGLVFWGAILDADSSALIGRYDRVEFRYGSGRHRCSLPAARRQP